MSEMINARIAKTTISMADHGCLTFQLFLEGDGWLAAYGGYCIGNGYLGAEDFSADNGGGLVAMMKIMDVVGVERWEDLNGKYVRVMSNGWGSSITEIGNIMEDKWFDIDEFFKNYQKDVKYNNEKAD